MKKRRKKNPKIELLKKISESIKLLLENLYPICEQLVIINKALENSSSISENTYLKFLKINLKDDYIRYKKNTFFVKKLEEIKKIVNSFYNLEEQFENFEPKIFLSGNMKFNLVFNDYKFFYNEYYIKYASSNLKNQ
ncbi:hypothetical protein ACOTWI_01135 [Aliarcobacter butzleri]